MLDHHIRSLPSNSKLGMPMYESHETLLRLCLPCLLQDACNAIIKGQALLTTLLQTAGWVSTNALCCDPQMILR